MTLCFGGISTDVVEVTPQRVSIASALSPAGDLIRERWLMKSFPPKNGPTQD